MLISGYGTRTSSGNMELFTPNVTGADIANPKADIHNLRVTHQEIQVGNAWGALRGETDPSTGDQKYNDINIKSALNYDRDKVGFKTVVDMASRTAGNTNTFEFTEWVKC